MVNSVVPINNDVSSAWEPPGVYFQIRAGGGGSSLADAFKRVIIFGYKKTAGTAPLNTLTRCTSQSDCATFVGQGSDIYRQYQAFISQAGQAISDVYLLPITEPSGTNATRLIVVAGPPTTAGSVDLFICGYLMSVRISTSDTATTIGDAIAAAINANLNLPCTAANVSGTVTLTYVHKGITGNDLPIIVNQYGASGVTFSAGTLTFANAATGAGSATLSVGATTITAAITNGQTAINSGIAMKNAINGGGYPFTATDDGAGVVTLFYATDRVVNKLSAAIVTSTVQTATLACGTPAPSNGSNRPTLTTALANLSNFAGGARLWLSPWFDATTVGAQATHIELMQNGQYQRDQFLFIGSNDSLATAGALPAATSPALSALYRYNVAICPDSPQQGYEEAARVCGAVAQQSYVPKNLDSYPLHTDPSQSVPLLLPHPAVRLAPQGDDSQTALHTYGLTPIAVSADGVRVIVKARTTWMTDAQLRDLPVALHMGFLRIRFVTAGAKAIAGKSIKRNGTPRTENTITLTQVKSALIAEARSLDDQDLFDGVDVWKDAFQLAPNSDFTRVDGFVPLAVIRPFHQLGLVGAPV